MRRDVRAILACGLGGVIFAATGCASQSSPPRPAAAVAARPGATSATAGHAAPATRPAPAQLALDEIEPAPQFPATRPAATTTAATPPPLEAIELFARARGHLLADERKQAAALLERAVRLDPDSFELHYALAEAYATNAGGSPESIAALERAAAIEPAHLELQTELGRQYLATGDAKSAINHLRLALKTEEYATDDELAALTEYLLARALRVEGYDRAALEVYERLIDRLRSPNMAIRGNRDLAMLASQPEAILLEIGELYERQGQPARAARAYEAAANRRPENLGHQRRLVRTLLKAGKSDDARARAADVVRRFRASPDSLQLLREAYGREDAVAAELRRLHAEKPDDRELLFALVEVLSSQGKRPEATRLLLAATERSAYDVEHVRRLFALYKEQPDQVHAAARLLIEAHARHPDAQDELTPLWSDLMRRSWNRRVRVGTIQDLEVSPRAEAAKLFWVAQLAQTWNRDLLARAALEQSAAASPPFAPSYRSLIARFWARDDWDEKRKVEESEKLVAAAAAADDKALAAELRGLLLLRQNKAADASKALARAIDLGATSPQVRIAQAAALLRQGRRADAEQLLWKLVEDRPTFEEAYDSLFGYYLQNNAAPQAVKVLQAWRQADPANLNARLLEATLFLQAKRFEQAEAILTSLFETHADSPEVLGTMRALYAGTGRAQQFVDKLEAERRRRPDNRVALEHLIDIYADAKRLGDASRVLDEARRAVADDPDLLYYLAHLYTRVGQEQTTEELLAQVVRLDPKHAPASNDLGYNWADKGRNLARAEELIRVALEAEPDNQSFLDSLGWVLYKRGKFAEAAERLHEAVAPATFPDPVVLDHLGDALYRLGKADEAERQWRRSWEQLARTGADRQDLRELRLTLQKKLKQLEAGQPISVAPVAEEPAAPPSGPKPQQAKTDSAPVAD